MEKLFKDIRTAISGTEKEFTRGSIRRAIFMLSVPMVLEMAMESLFAVVDVFFVSKVGVEAAATIGLTESVLFLVYSIAIGLSMAATAMVARRVGEEDREAAAVAAGQAIVIGLLLAAPISIIGLVYAEELLILMGGSESLVASGSGYMRMMLAGNFTIMLLFLINAIFRGAGDASLAMRSLWIANGLNLVLDPCLIFGLGPFPELGVTGAAVATNIGRGIGVAYQLYILLKGDAVVAIAWRHLRLRFQIISRLLRVSLGGMGQHLIGSASWIFMVRIISIFGSEALAGYTIAFRIIIFTILPSWGMANAAATLVGQNLGANQPERAEESVWKTSLYNMLFLLGISILFYIWAQEIIRLFSPDPEVIHYGVMSLRIICTGYLFYAYGMVISQAFNGAGDTRTPTLINLVAFWLVQIPMAYLLSIGLDWGPAGVFWAIPISESLLAVIAIILFRRGRWKLINI